jgi:hypothetical protein
MWLARITLLILLLGSTSLARAEADESVLWGGLQSVNWTRAEGISASSAAALSGVLGARYGVDDFWEIAAQVGGGANVTESSRGAGFGVATLEARYIIDALTWVPWVCAGMGAIARGGLNDQDPRLDMAAHLGVGLDYRPERAWGLSFSARVHSPLTDPERSSGPLETTLAYAWYLD